MRLFYSIVLIMLGLPLYAQNWMIECAAGMAQYNGDLTKSFISLQQIRPSVSVNIKYNTDQYINLRAGFTYARLHGDDQNNREEDLRIRNLNFTTGLVEFHAAAELNLLNPEVFYAYPYLYGGVGMFYFNPFTYDGQGVKQYLQPLGTEGQGLTDYPDKKKYSKLQVCVPVGAGWKIRLSRQREISFEAGYRFLLTDYLDDVSGTYPSPEILEAGNGPVAAELSYRKEVPFMDEGEARGNSGVKDLYFFAQVKMAWNLNRFRKIRNYRRHD